MRQALDRIPGPVLILLTLTTLTALCAAPAAAGVTVDIDAPTLNRILAAISVTEVEMPISAQNSVTVELHDLRVTGFDPSAEEGTAGAILTAVRVVAPELGLEMQLEPRIAVDVVRDGDSAALELRFEDLGLKVPFVGQINLATLVPPMRYPADNVFLMPGAQGDVPVTSRLKGIKMGRERIRFELEIEVPAGP